jgi:hypothetical protein
MWTGHEIVFDFSVQRLFEIFVASKNIQRIKLNKNAEMRVKPSCKLFVISDCNKIACLRILVNPQVENLFKTSSGILGRQTDRQRDVLRPTDRVYNFSLRIRQVLFLFNF